MELICRKSEQSFVQVVVDYIKPNGIDYESVETIFDISFLENEYFVEFLKWLLSYGSTIFNEYFYEFMFIPTEDNEPLEIDDIRVRKIINGELYNITISE